MANAHDDEAGLPTTGHEWDGIREYDKPMPRWWLITFAACVVWAIGYMVVYPAIPLLTDATKGTLNWSSRRELATEMQSVVAARAPILAKINSLPLEQVAQDKQLMRFAVEGGRSAFKVYCSQCHGSGAAGGAGYPNLNDDEWLWGGDLASIHLTLQHGVRSADDEATRMSQMPSFGRDGILKPSEIRDVTTYVRTISGQAPASRASQRGAPLFAANCAACHSADGKGNRAFGAPDLTDAIWLYGGDRASIRSTIANARYGVMPAWGARLDPVTVKQLALYVHSLGGGE